jgi:hypothetical protein
MRGMLGLALLVAAGCEQASTRPEQHESPAPSLASPALVKPRASSLETLKSARPTPPAPDPEPAAPRPRALIEKPPSTWAVQNAAWKGPIDPKGDRVWIERLASAPIVEIVRNKGGATLTLRVRFADGARAAFKPEQTHSASNHRAEIAAFHLDRVLGFGRTATVVGRSLNAARLRRWLVHAEVESAWLARFDGEVKVRDGLVHGALIAWHDKRLADAAPPRDWARTLLDADASALPTERTLEWSDMVMFDYLLDNGDRWSGGNVLSLGNGGPLIFLDNAAGLQRRGLIEPEKSPVGPVCRFRETSVSSLKSTVGRLGARLERSLSADPLSPVVSDAHLRAIDARLEKLLAHIDRCVEDHGAERVLVP